MAGSAGVNEAEILNMWERMSDGERAKFLGQYDKFRAAAGKAVAKKVSVSMVETRDQTHKTLGDRIHSFRRLNVDSLGTAMAKIMVSQGHQRTNLFYHLDNSWRLIRIINDITAVPRR